MAYKAVVIGTSAGGMEALGLILEKLPSNFPVPILIVQHLSPDSDGYMARRFNELYGLKIKEADEKEKPLPGTVYIAPANYHLLVEIDQHLSLTVGEKVNYARPSVDVLFESAADTYGSGLIGIILTGANSDGSNGLKVIKENGGLAIVQNPYRAVAQAMPKAAIKMADVDYVLEVSEIGEKLIELVGCRNGREMG